jgi:hypothetical protein
MGRFIKGIDGIAAMAGVGTSILVMILVALFTEINWLWYVAMGFAISLAIGLVADTLMAKIRETGKKVTPGPR